MRKDSKIDDETRFTEGTTSNPDQDSLDEYLEREMLAEKDAQIKYRSMSWQKTAALVFSEYVCLAVLSFPWSYSVLGLVPGIIVTAFVSLTVTYTSLVLWEFCLRNPTVMSVSDIGQKLFWGKKWAWYFTSICFLLNNTFIMGLHVLVGAKYLNTVSNHGACTVVFAIVVAIISWICSLPRTFAGLSSLALFSAVATGISILLTMIFAAIQDHPFDYDAAVPVQWNLWPKPGTTYVNAMVAALNIVYTFVGQITYPSFIAEMKNPRDFRKAVYAISVCQIVLYVIAGSICYVYVGDAYITSPAIGSLTRTYKIVAFSFMIPTLIFLGVLYAAVSARFLFLEVIFEKHSHHAHNHTVFGWAVWAGLLAGLWILAFIIAEAIPFFSDLLSLMSSLFDCWFGYVFWGVAYLQMRQEDFGPGWWKRLSPWGYFMLAINLVIIALGFYILGPGVYSTVQAIINDYESGLFGSAFTCASNAL